MQTTQEHVNVNTMYLLGAFGDVYKGRLRGMTTVAIKKLTGVNQTAFLREAKIMQQIPNHPNVVTFYGVAASQNVLYIVTEFVPNGSLSVIFLCL